MKNQKTLKASIRAKGKGLHSGKLMHMTLKPAPEDTGIVFIREDLSPEKKIPINPQNIVETPLCTTLVLDDIKIYTIEHLMSVLCALEIDNLFIYLDGPEVPVMDGSAEPFIFLIQSAGIQEQQKPRSYIVIKKMISCSSADKYAEISPSPHGLTFNLTIDFDHPVIQKTNQEIDFKLRTLPYIKEVSRARTFGIAQDLDKLHQQSLALGAGLENAIGIGPNDILNPEGLRYPDEFVRHKLLDTIGDLYVAGPIIGHYKAYKPGHALNNQLIRTLLATPNAYEISTL